MSGSFLRNCSKRCMHGFTNCRSLLEPSLSSSSSSITRSSAQHWRAYYQSRVLYKNNAESKISSTFSLSVSSTSFSRNGFVGWYLGMIDAHPVLTKSVTAGFIFMAADVSSQMITLKSSGSLDTIRTLRMVGYGMLLSGPSLHLWFNFVSKILPKRDVVTTLKKLALGQTVYGPIMTVVFFSVNAGLQGETGSEIVARLKRDLIPTFKSGLAYWPICDFITFKFIPVRLQPLVSNSFSFLWTIYITYMASRQKVGAEKDTTD